MEDIRKRLFIIISIVVGIILAVVLFLVFFNKPRQSTAPESDVQTTPQSGSGVKSNQSSGGAQKAPETLVSVKPAVASEDVYVKQLAGIFVERFLGYSNQNNNQHIEDALLLSTDKMASWIKKQGEQWSMDYQGSSATVVASQLKEMGKDIAIVGVDVQQSFEGKEEKTVYKSGRVEIVKVDGEWKVNGFYWE